MPGEAPPLRLALAPAPASTAERGDAPAMSAPSGPARGRRRSPRALLIGLMLAGCVAGTCLAASVPGERPGIFLQGATVARARALALDAALVKGWRVVESGRDHVLFETMLEQPASMGPPNAIVPDQTTLRIRADFVATPAGVNAYLYAEEIWYAHTSKQWVNDVTPQYRSNLSHALESLQRQWSAIAPNGRAADDTPGPAGEPATAPAAAAKVRVKPLSPAAGPPASAPVPAYPQTQPEQADVEVGVWAYHAEQYARAQGCTLDDVGAELISGDSASELHRVHCQGGDSVLVRCDRESCHGAR